MLLSKTHLALPELSALRNDPPSPIGTVRPAVATPRLSLLTVTIECFYGATESGAKRCQTADPRLPRLSTAWPGTLDFWASPTRNLHHALEFSSPLTRAAQSPHPRYKMQDRPCSRLSRLAGAGGPPGYSAIKLHLFQTDHPLTHNPPYRVPIERAEKPQRSGLDLARSIHTELLDDCLRGNRIQVPALSMIAEFSLGGLETPVPSTRP